MHPGQPLLIYLMYPKETVRHTWRQTLLSHVKQQTEQPSLLCGDQRIFQPLWGAPSIVAVDYEVHSSWGS